MSRIMKTMQNAEIHCSCGNDNLNFSIDKQGDELQVTLLSPPGPEHDNPDIRCRYLVAVQEKGRGAGALRVAFDEVREGWSVEQATRLERGFLGTVEKANWKPVAFLPAGSGADADGKVAMAAETPEQSVARLTRERDETRAELMRVADASVDLMATLRALVATGRMKTMPEMEALEIALTLPPS